MTPKDNSQQPGRLSLTMVRVFAILMTLSMAASAQEVAFIDLTNGEQRTKLRYPPAPPARCGGGFCVGSGIGGGSVACGAPSPHDKRALKTTLLWAEVTRDETTLDFEVWLENVGEVPLPIPVSPHLADLQPADASLSFDYESISIVVGSARDVRQTIGVLTIYGSKEHEQSLVLLQPGEWIRVRGMIPWQPAPEQAGQEPLLTAGFWLRSSTFKPRPGGSFTDIRNLYPHAHQGPAIELRMPTRQEPAIAAAGVDH